MEDKRLINYYEDTQEQAYIEARVLLHWFIAALLALVFFWMPLVLVLNKIF